MGILAGAVSARRYHVVGEIDGDWREKFREALDTYAFQDRAIEQGKEELEGWVSAHNILDTSFADLSQWLYNEWAVFALRVDKKALPARLVSATVQKRAQAWCKERGVEKCPTAIKRQLKEDLEKEWLARTLPRVATTECAWNIVEKRMLLHTLSEKQADRFRTRFLRTFGLKLIAWSPLDDLGDVDLREALVIGAPTPLGRIS